MDIKRHMKVTEAVRQATIAWRSQSWYLHQLLVSSVRGRSNSGGILARATSIQYGDSANQGNQGH